MGENPLIEGLRKDGERVTIDISLTPVTIDDEPYAMAMIKDTRRIAEQYSQRITELTAMSDIASLSRTGLDAYETVQILSRQVRNLIPYDRFVIVTYDNLNSVAKRLVRGRSRHL